MRILVIGGTQFVGRHIVAAALAQGHDVTVFHRGRTGADLFPQAHHIRGDRDSDLSGLVTGEWDATIDVCAYFPGQVRVLADALRGRGGHHAFISTVSVYDIPAAPGYSESSALLPAAPVGTTDMSDGMYGPLKVACELAVAGCYGPSALVIRPTYVVGPYDYTGRFTWWLHRLARGGEVLAPGPQDGPVQVIDARDMADWIVRLVAARTGGTFHAVSPPPPFTFAELLAAIAAEVAPPGTTLTWVDAEFLAAAGMDEASLPLWAGADPDALTMTADPAAAYTAGLAPRPLAQTIRETFAHETVTPTPTRDAVGLSAEREADLLARWRVVSG